MPEQQPAVAELTEVGHRYGETIALEPLRLAIPAGRMAGLIGPDGVGKSTLLGLLAGVRRLQAGRLEVLGGDMAAIGHRRAVCQRIAYMPQGLGRNLYATLSVRENVDFFARLFGQGAAERSARIEELLAGTDLAAFADRPAGKLSGGMRQKLGLACALIHDPDLLILDEPTTGVDPLSRQRFWELIDRLRGRREGMSVIVATAYMAEAEELDWLVAMDAGRMLATGTPDELRAQTGTDNLADAFVVLSKGAEAAKSTPSIPPRTRADGGPVIRAHGLTKRFGDFTAVDAVSFTIEKGEIFGFLGSNGCGKTTTMKMLTGLLPASEGEAELLGQPIDARDLETRGRVGYMSQSFSLYDDLTVRQNLVLHARLFHLPARRIEPRVEAMLERFELVSVADQLPASLPLGLRQRLSLAVAIIHEPEMLILDEPTSGVDPAARDAFWQILGELSRAEGVTIFISTHFMNEAERCDRISLMHAGRVLAIDTPEALQKEKGADSLEDAFVAYLEAADAEETGTKPAAPARSIPPEMARAHGGSGRPAILGGALRAWAYARREAVELLRDPVRIAFAALGPVLLMIAFGYGISFDVEDLAYAVLDQDRTPESRRYLEDFASSRYFLEGQPIEDGDAILPRLQSGEIALAIELPPDFGHDLISGRRPEVAVWIDGAMPFRATTIESYARGVTDGYLHDLARGNEVPPVAAQAAVEVAPRFRYNQAFDSTVAVTPGVIMLLLIVIPAMLTAVGVVREKELGSIINLYATPTTRLEYLLGKQLPYVVVGLLAFVILTAMTLFLFQVPLAGSAFALALGALLYLFATTALGLLISTFVKTQVAALFGAAIITTISAINFSGLLMPASSLDGASRLFALIFPSGWFQTISVGVFAKGLGAGSLTAEYAAIALFAVVATAAAAALLPTQER